MRSLISLTAVTIVLFSLPAVGTIINVPGDYSAIQTAINAAVDNDTVLVANGTYAENIDFAGKAILLTSQSGPENTAIVVQASGSPVVTFDSGEGPNSVLSGFTIDGDSSYWGVYLDGTSPIIYNNIIKNHEVGIRVDNGGSPLIRKNEIMLCSHSVIGPRNGGGIRMIQATNAVIDSNEIHDNYSDVAGGIFLYQCSNITVERNLIYSNSAVYIGGLEISTCDSIYVYNNTLVDNLSITTILGSINVTYSNFVTIFNNISAFNNEYGIRDNTHNTLLIVDYNDAYGNSHDNYSNVSPGAGGISADPLFINLALNNFYLDINSPCINTGNSIFPLDPDGTVIDMGAIYFDSGNWGYGSLAGVVTDTSGSPVENVQVSIIQTGREDTTDLNGEYLIDSLLSWMDYQVLFSRPGYVDTLITDVSIYIDDTTYVDVVLNYPGAIAGVVTDSLGAIEGVFVEAIGTTVNDYTNASGQYYLDGLNPGSHDVSFSHIDYEDTIISNVTVSIGDTTYLDVTLHGMALCEYVVGDFNYSGNFNVLDFSYGVDYFRGMVNLTSWCECTPGWIWYPQGDVNGNCVFNGLDLLAMYDYFRHYSSEVTPCPDCPPAGWPLSNSNFEEIIASIDFDYSSPIINLKDQAWPKSDNVLLTDNGVELWFGNLDESPIDALPGESVAIDVYIQMASDAHVGSFNLPLGADDAYISGFLSESLGQIYGISDWDIAEFVPVDGSPPNPAGWSSQSLLAIIELYPPYLGDWMHYESPTLLGTFVLQTINDSSFANQTVQCIGPGISSRNGAAVFGDNTSLIEHEVTQHFSPIHFLDPSAYAGALMGTVTDITQNPIEGALVTVEGTTHFDITDTSGNFIIENIIEGFCDVGFSHALYQDTILTGISIVANDTTTVDVILYEGLMSEVTVMYGTMNGVPLNAVIGSRLNIDVYIQTGTDVWVEYLTIVLGLEDQYFDSLLSQNEGQIFDVLLLWDEVLFYAPTGSPPNPAGWSTESMVGFSRLFPPYDNPRLNCPTPTKIASFVVKIPNDSSLIGDTVLCMGPGINYNNEVTIFGDTTGTYEFEYIEYFSPIHFVDPQSATGALTGTVTNGAQQPVMGVIVTVEGTGRTDITNSIGVYHIDDIIQDNYEVSFSHPNYCDTILTGVSIIANQTTIADMTMGGIGFIDGLVTDSDQNPIDSVIINVEGTDVTDTTDSNGTYLLRSLCPGTHSVSFNHPDYVEHIESDITVAENDTAHVDVTLWAPISNDLVVWYGPPDGSPTIAVVGERVNIDVYIQTGSDIQVGFFHIALGTEDQYFDSLLSESEGMFYDVIPQWDLIDFLSPDGSPPNPAGWSNQSAMGFRHIIGAPGPPLFCPGPTKILTYVVRVTDDSTLVGDTVNCLGPGYNPGMGNTVFGDTLENIITDFVQNFNPLYFVSSSYYGAVSGTVTDSAEFAIEGVVVTVQGTGISDTTDGSGQYSCENIDPGTYNVSFNHPDYMLVIVGDVNVSGGQVTVVDVTLYEPTGNCNYVVGDVNNSGIFNGLDITFGVNFFKGGQAPLYSCECTPGNIWYVAGDINNSCSYNGLDVTYGVAYFKGGPAPMPCADCPPVSLISVIGKNEKSIDNSDSER